MIKLKLYDLNSGPVCVCPPSLLMLPLRVDIRTEGTQKQDSKSDSFLVPTH